MEGGTGSTGDDGGFDDAGADDGVSYMVLMFVNLLECTLTLIDSYGDGWNGNVWSSGDQSAALDDGALGTADFCFDLSVENTYTCDGGSYQTEVSWELVCDGELIVEGGAPAMGGFGGSTVPGCTDPSADNYNSEATITMVLVFLVIEVRELSHVLMEYNVLLHHIYVMVQLNMIMLLGDQIVMMVLMKEQNVVNQVIMLMKFVLKIKQVIYSVMLF